MLSGSSQGVLGVLREDELEYSAFHLWLTVQPWCSRPVVSGLHKILTLLTLNPNLVCGMKVVGEAAGGL